MSAAPGSGSGERGLVERPLAERLRFIWRMWRPHRRSLILLAGLTAVSTAVTVGYPLVLQRVIDGAAVAFEGGPRAPIGHLLLVLAAIAVGRAVAYLYPGARAWLNRRLAATERARVFDQVLDGDDRFLSRFRTGDLLTRLTDDLDEFPKLAWFCCSGIFRAVESGSKVLLSVVAMLWLSPGLAALSLLPLPIMLWIFFRAQRQLRQAYLRQQKAISETNDLLESAFSGIQAVKAFNTENAYASRLGGILDRRVDHQLEVQRLFAKVRNADAMASRGGQLITLLVGGFLAMRGELSIGTLYALYAYLDMLVHPLQDLPHLFVTARMAFGSMDRLLEVHEAHAESALGEEPAPLLVGRPLERVEVVDATVRYPGGRDDALQGVSLQLEPGERLAVVGPVGSGKSTLIRLLAGIARAAEGEVRVDGRRLPSPAPEDYREALGYVPQEALLFSETIAWNVSLGRADEGRERGRALATAQLDEDLRELPKGEETVLGARGARISGGQRQRVALARALARRPRLLLLDDSTASLDAIREHRFWNALDEHMPDTTTVVTTHRLATVERADRVLVLERGRVRALGRHEDLVRDDAAYRRLLALEA